MRNFSFTLILLVLFPVHAFAYEVPERDYWRAFALSLINKSREEQNLKPLGLDASLNTLAQGHAIDSSLHFDESSIESIVSSYIVHMSSDGRTLLDRTRDENITHLRKIGENVGFRARSGFSNVHRAIEESLHVLHNSMMEEVPPDDSHRVTILTPEYTHVGVGLELHHTSGKNKNRVFLVTNFAIFTDGRERFIPEVGLRPDILKRIHQVRMRVMERLKRRGIDTASQ